MTASKLDRIVTFDRAQLVDDGFGVSQVWADHGGPIWAARADVSDGEKARAGGIEASLLSRFTVRSTPFTRDLNAKDRLHHDGLVWNVLGVKEADHGRLRFLEITATARTDG